MASIPSSTGVGPSISNSKSIHGNGNGDQNTRADDISVEMIEIPSTGLEFFEYRRRLFLAGLPLPPTPLIPLASSSSSSSSSSAPTSPRMRIPKYLPPPKPAPFGRGPTSAAARRLEELLADDGSEELQSNWDKGVGQVARHMHAGKKLAKGLRLGLVIKVLKASWIQDGLWPVDARGRPIKPPDSPIIEGIDLFPTRPTEEENRGHDQGSIRGDTKDGAGGQVDAKANGRVGQNGLLPISVLEMVEDPVPQSRDGQ
ncbi:hypothetical protein I317_05805 [Kwoniella heveanensis CBS 569]|nr:hypothetical protein I317_05805 [Kwoniella heveanensis CBS 569]